MNNNNEINEEIIDENTDTLSSVSDEITGENSEGNDSKNDKGETSFVKELLSWIMVFVVAACAAYLITHFLIINAVVPTGSMISTINEGDKVIGNRLAYKFSEPERGDIVLFWAPNKENTIYIKRLIGVPGDTIHIEGGKLFINGEEQNEPYVNGKPTYAITGTESNKDTVFEYTLKDDEYFMMGDNRTGSNDSRAWGTVSKKAIIAKGWIKWSPKIKKLK